MKGNEVQVVLSSGKFRSFGIHMTRQFYNGSEPEEPSRDKSGDSEALHDHRVFGAEAKCHARTYS